MTIATMKLTPLQNDCINKIMQWQYEGYPGQVFNVHGYAGTGKTTVLSYLQEHILSSFTVLYVTYTGKAVEKLLSVGCPKNNTKTIHSTFKRPETDEDDCLRFRPVERNDCLDRYGDWIKDCIFNCDLVVLDESSMVDSDMANDILKYGKPVISFGDKFQLPPITDCVTKKISKFTEETDFLLDEVHRQALDSGIIQVATMIRSGEWEKLRRFEAKEDCSVFWTNRDQFLEFSDFGQPICYGNFTRYDLTKKIKKQDVFLPQAGDPVMCVTNNRNAGLFNGLTMNIDKVCWIDNKENQIRFIDSFGKIRTSELDYFRMYNEKLNRAQVQEYIKEVRKNQKGFAQWFDYSYVITAHKAQGSEYPTVTVYDDNYSDANENYARWLYTAVTRAKQKLNLMMSASMFKKRFGIL